MNTVCTVWCTDLYLHGSVYFHTMAVSCRPRRGEGYGEGALVNSVHHAFEADWVCIGFLREKEGGGGGRSVLSVTDRALGDGLMELTSSSLSRSTRKFPGDDCGAPMPMPSISELCLVAPRSGVAKLKT